MDAEINGAHRKLSILQLAESLHNVSEACRQCGVSRTQFYEYKRRYLNDGIEGLKDLPRIPKSNPLTTSPEHVERILALSLEHYPWGCSKLCDNLALEGIKISYPTIQKILNKHDMGTRSERLLTLEKLSLSNQIELSLQQLALIEKSNPCFRERHNESSIPGKVLCQDTLYVGMLKSLRRVYLHAVVDTYSSYAFGYLHTAKVPSAAIEVIEYDVIRFYNHNSLKVDQILTTKGREFYGTGTHPYKIFIEDCGIKQGFIQGGKTHKNGFMERFYRTVMDEFFHNALRNKLYESVETLQVDLDAWLVYYNTERPHLGYRNQGRRPFEAVQLYLSNGL